MTFGVKLMMIKFLSSLRKSLIFFLDYGFECHVLMASHFISTETLCPWQ